jgi:hypothetical protein
MPDPTDRPRYPDDDTAFREWANDPEHDEAVQGLVADFVADEGAEMVLDLIDAVGPNKQWTAERWISRLRTRFERWWTEGRPRLPASRKVTIVHNLAAQDAEARRLLQDNLPVAATFSLTRRWRKSAGGASEPAGCSCKIEDGAAIAAAHGDTPAAAAQRALDAWREFVTASRATIEDAATERPPLLDAPSSTSDEAEAQPKEQKRVS